MVTTFLTLSVSFVCAFSVVLAIAGYVFFVAASVALARGRLVRVEELVEQGASGARRAEGILRNPESFLLCAQFGRVLTSLASGCLLVGFSFLVSYQLLGLSGIESLKATGVLALALYLLCASVVLLIVQVVKAAAMQFPEDVLCWVALPLAIHSWLWNPVLLSVRNITRGVLNWWGIREANEREVTISAAELGEIVKVSSEAGTLESDDRQLLGGIAELSERVARDVMTPRKDVVWVRDSASTMEILEMLRKEPVSRLLVCGEDLDDVRGVLLGWNLLEFVGVSPEPGAWRTFIRPAYRIPDTRVVRELLAEMRQKQVHFGVVLNEHGELVGIVTLEDLVEEIVGEIFDEFESPRPEASAVSEVEGELHIDGATSIHELAEKHEINLPAGEYQTLGGFILDQLGRIPVAGDTFSVERLTFSVLEVHKRRVARVSVRRIPESGLDEPGDWKGGRRLASGS
jgi:putative hemolysin